MTGKLQGQLSMTGFLKGVTARVYQALASVADDHGQSWYSYHSLAQMARCSRKSAIEAVKWLERHGLMTVHRGASFTTSSGRRTRGTNLYTLNLSFIEALVTICTTMRKLTPGGSDLKCETVQRAADWAEEMVRNHSCETVVELATKKPAEVRRVAAGLPDGAPADGTGEETVS